MSGNDSDPAHPNIMKMRRTVDMMSRAEANKESKSARLSVNYISSKQAAAVRSVVDGLATWTYNAHDMTFWIDGVTVPADITKQYIVDWTASGLWRLPTAEDITAGGQKALPPVDQEKGNEG